MQRDAHLHVARPEDAKPAGQNSFTTSTTSQARARVAAVALRAREIRRAVEASAKHRDEALRYSYWLNIPCAAGGMLNALVEALRLDNERD